MDNEIKENVVSDNINAQPDSLGVAPEINIDELNNASPEEREKMLKDYSEKLTCYESNKAKSENSELMDKYNRAMAYIDGVKAKEELGRMPEFTDFNQMLPKIEKLTGIIPGAESMSPMELYTVGYLVAKGLESTKNGAKKKTTEERLLEITSDEKLMKALEEKRISELTSRENLPAIGTFGGLSSSKVNLTKKPQTIDEAYRQSIKEFD